MLTSPERPDGKLLIHGLATVSGFGVDPISNRLSICQPNYTLGFHVPIYPHLPWIKKLTKLDLCLEAKKLVFDSDDLFDLALFIIAYSTCTIVLLSLIADQRAKFLRLDFSFAESGKEAGVKPGEKSETGAEKKKSSFFPIRVKVSLSLDKLAKK